MISNSKLSNFPTIQGFSKILGISGRVGVSHFMAPEVVSDVEYGTKADMWSAGVLLYILLCGRLPFVGARQKVYESITEGKYSVKILYEF